MKYPRTRILRKIWRMQEELDLIQSVSFQQQDLLTNYTRILDPASFRIKTSSRATHFQIEGPFIKQQALKRFEVRMRLGDIDSRLEDVSKHVARMLEIQQEDNGNSIFVFTIVTIIFLPLSWATSYLGMNTADVRSLNQGQWLYWVIALPVTIVVIAVAIVVVLKGEMLRELVVKNRVAKETAPKTMSAPIPGIMRRSSTAISTTSESSVDRRLWQRLSWRKVKDDPGSKV